MTTSNGHDHRGSLQHIAAALLATGLLLAGCSNPASTTGRTSAETQAPAGADASRPSHAASSTDSRDSTSTSANPDNAIPGANGATPMVSYFEPTEASLGATLDYLGDGSFVMLNLFRLRDVPDFSAHPELEPQTPMSSRDLFYQYIAHMDTYLEEVGAKRILLADGGPLLIGPEGEHWDVVQMVEYPNTQSFIELGLLVRAEVSLREVMLADSRIMPMHERPLDAVTEVG